MLFNMIGGGAGGATGTATLIVSSPANVIVTVVKNSKSYTKNSGDLGSTVFKGLTTGTWTVTISSNGQTATKTIEITADYVVTIAFFAAYINITYPANSTCVVTNGNGQTVASNTNNTSSTKAWTATVNSKGTYTITTTAIGSSDENVSTVSINADKQTVEIEIEFKNYVIHNGILKDGYQIVVNNSSATYELVDGALEFRSTQSSGGNGNITINANGQPINLSGINAVYFDTAATSPRSGTLDYVQWGVSGASTVKKNLGVNNPITRRIVPVEVSNISSGNINLFISDVWGTVALKIYDIWLE